MNLIFRLLWVIIAAFWRPGITRLQIARLKTLTFPNDLDINLHVNNGRFLTLLDLGRMDWILRAGMLPVLRKNRWHPVVASLEIDFRRSLGAFDFIEIVTEVTRWDDKWVYMAQQIEANGKIAAKAEMKTIFLSRNGKVKPDDLVKAMGYDDLQSPDISGH